MRAVLIACLWLCGCGAMPFVGVGVGVGLDTGYYFGIDETGCLGTAEAGIEFEDRWYWFDECGVYHRSQCRKKPELITNDALCKKRWGGRQ